MWIVVKQKFGNDYSRPACKYMRPMIILSLLFPVSRCSRPPWSFYPWRYSSLSLQVHSRCGASSEITNIDPWMRGWGTPLPVQSKICCNLSETSACEDSQLLADPWTTWVWTAWVHGKNLHIDGPAQFKSALFKGQL